MQASRPADQGAIAVHVVVVLLLDTRDVALQALQLGLQGRALGLELGTPLAFALKVSAQLLELRGGSLSACPLAPDAAHAPACVL